MMVKIKVTVTVIKVRRETVVTEAFYVLLGLKEDHTREILGIINILQESVSGWQEVLEDIRSRGVQGVGFFVFDGLTGLDEVVGRVYSNSMKQNWILHFSRNLNKHIRKAHREDFCVELKRIYSIQVMSSLPLNKELITSKKF